MDCVTVAVTPWTTNYGTPGRLQANDLPSKQPASETLMVKTTRRQPATNAIMNAAFNAFRKSVHVDREFANKTGGFEISESGTCGMCVWCRAFDHPECWSKGVHDVKKPCLSGVQPQDGQQQLERVTHATLQRVGQRFAEKYVCLKSSKPSRLLREVHAHDFDATPSECERWQQRKQREGRSKVQSAPIWAEKNFFNIKEAATHLLDQRLEILVQSSRYFSAARGPRVRMHVEDVQQASNRSAACWDMSGARSKALKLRKLLHLGERFGGRPGYCMAQQELHPISRFAWPS